MTYQPIYRPIYKPIRKPIGSEVSGGGESSLDILASVGSSLSHLFTGTKAVTGVGFQPKTLITFANLQTADGSASGALMGIGAASSTTARATISGSAQTGVTTTNAYNLHTNASVTSCLGSAGTVTEQADLSSFDADGFTLNWDVATASARILNHICLGGADLEVNITQHLTNDDNSLQSLAHGLSGEPTGLMLLSTNSSTAPPAIGGNSNLQVGMYAGGSQANAGATSLGGFSISVTYHHLLDDNFYAYPIGGSFSRRAAVTSVDSTNVNISYGSSKNTTQSYFYLIAFRGAKCQVGTFDCNGSTAPLTINTTGITPKLFLPVLISGGVDNINTDVAGTVMSFGASDGTNIRLCQITDESGLVTTNAKRTQESSALAERNYAGSTVHSSSVAFSGESVIIDPTILTDSAYAQGAYLVLGS